MMTPPQTITESVGIQMRSPYDKPTHGKTIRHRVIALLAVALAALIWAMLNTTVAADTLDRCEPHWDNAIGQPGMGSSVRAMAVFDDGTGFPALYAGGFFTSAGGVPANYIAKWSGLQWSPVGSGVSGGWILALTVFDDGSGSGPALYTGGYFTSAGGQPANRVARWDGSQWSPVGEGVGPIHALASYDGDDGPPGFGPALYAGGVFQTSGEDPAIRVAKWDGSQWSALGSGMDDTVYALVVFDDGTGPALYAGGSFTTAGGKPANRVAKWDGSEWWPLGAGLDFGSVRALAVFDDGSGSGPALYAGGWFTFTDFPNGQEVSRIAKWDGSQWLPLGSGVNGDVQDLVVLDDGTGSDSVLYVGGWFTSAGGQPANRIAKWDGSEWSPLGSGLTGGGIYALATFAEPVPTLAPLPAVYAGGAFNTAGGEEANKIAVWRDCLSALQIPGDLNGDGVVDGADLLILLSIWGKCDDPDECPGDMNNNGVVDGADLLILLANWG